MKKLLIILLTICHIVAYAQTSSDYQTREKEGMLSFEECMAAPFENYDRVMPSLLHLEKLYSESGNYNAYIYNKIISQISYYYICNGNLVSARQILDEAENTFGKFEHEPNNKYTRDLLIRRGQLEVLLKNYSDAVEYLSAANKYFEAANIFDESYMVMLMNMAIACQGDGDLALAKIYIDESREQFEKQTGMSIFDIKDERMFIFLANYGYIYYTIGKDEVAEKCFLDVINNSKDTPLSHPAYTLASNNLANLYIRQDKWTEAARLLEKLKNANNEFNYTFAQNLCLCYLYLHEYAKLEVVQKDMNLYSLGNIESLFSGMTQTETENYWSVISTERILINNLIAYYTHSDNALCTAYDNAILCKSFLINSSRIIDKVVGKSGNSDLVDMYNRNKLLREQLAYKSKGISHDSIGREIIETERYVLANIGNLGERIERETPSWQQVRDALGGDEVAIEYCYAPTMDKYPGVKANYGALILRKNFQHPILVVLTTADSVENIIDRDNPDAMFVNDVYAKENSKKLYDMLWKKITPYMKGIKTVYYSPTGMLSNINIGALQSDDNKFLNELYSMRCVSSTGNIAKVKSSTDRFRSAALYGDIAYSELPEEMAGASKNYNMFSGSDISSGLAMRSENERGRWGDIPSTKNEIDSIASILEKNGTKVKRMEGKAANEESVKMLSGNAPDILHFATHGFLIDNEERARGNKFFESTVGYSPKEAYMMWAGLILAGGNNAWLGNFNLKDVEDGILTADEISRMNLENAKMVVLSACETGRGRIDPVDGVYGLQRAFKIAGAGTVVMSLWKVQDSATSLLMTKFYTYLAGGTERHQALWQAMMDVRKIYRDPYYWAGFVMLD